MLPTVLTSRFRSISWFRNLVLVAVLCLATTAGAVTVQLSGPAGASVRVDGKDLGLLPLASFEMTPGAYKFVARKHGYEKFSQTIVIRGSDDLVHLELRLLPLKHSNVMTGSLVFAGLGQWHMGAKVRGWIYFLGEAGGLVTALGAELQRANYKDDYINYQTAYDYAITDSDIAFYKSETQQAYDNMIEMRDLRDTGLYVALGAYVVSLLDAWLLFPNVDIGPGMVAPTASLAEPPTWETGLHAAVSFEF